jgi:EAL domain-containing protein (putative c-di-GMP-specific phosphodiesterase class I)
VEFIAAAEESGAIGALGNWVLQRACEAAMHWPAAMRVAVNVSAQQLVQPNWVRQVREILAITKLSPERLELELTETALIENTAVAMSAIVQLRALGVRVALDDFGTGYSSLAYLRRFPFDKIKIDQSFVVGITRDPGALAIVTAVARLATALQLEVTAEGVENNEQTKLLRELGCTSLQGYLFARPMTGESMRQYVATDYAIAGLPGVAFRYIDSVTGDVVAGSLDRKASARTSSHSDQCCFSVGCSVNFCRRQFNNSATKSSFSAGHAISCIQPNCLSCLPEPPSHPST